MSGDLALRLTGGWISVFSRHLAIPAHHLFICRPITLGEVAFHLRKAFVQLLGKKLEVRGASGGDLFDSIDSPPVGSPSGVIHSEATIRQHLTRSRFPGVRLDRAGEPVHDSLLLFHEALRTCCLHRH